MNLPTLDELKARRNAIKRELKRFAEPIALTRSEQERFEELATEYDDLDNRIDELEERKAMTARAAAVLPDSFNVNTRRSDPTDCDALKIDGPEARSRAIDVVERNPKQFASSAWAEGLTQTLEQLNEVGETASRMALVTGTPEYRSAFVRAMTVGTAGLLDAEKVMLGRAYAARDFGERGAVEERTMTAGTGSSGGYLVPLSLDPSMVLTGSGSQNAFRQVANVKQTNTLAPYFASAAQVSAGYIAENAAFSDNSPTITQLQITTYKAGAYIPASFEAFEDIAGLVGDVGLLMRDARDNFESSEMTNGTGSSAVKGIVTAVNAVGGSKVAPTTGGAFVVGDIYKVDNALPPRYRRTNNMTPTGGQVAWLSSINILNTIRQFATANNYMAFLSDLSAEFPARMLGKPIYETSSMDTSVTTGQKILLFGDFSRYYIVDRVGVEIEFIPQVFDQASGRPSGTRAWIMHWRFGADCIDANAFRLLVL